MQYAYWIYGWIVIRPIRWFFGKLISNSFECRWWFTKREYREDYRWPNFHWYFLYKTVFKFFKWLNYTAWRKFCKWQDGYRKTMPWIAKLIKGIGKTTAGYAISGGQCFHCGSPEGNQVLLATEPMYDDYFELKETWDVTTMDGTDHCFRGITTCPKCGYQDTYEDGSL